MANRTQNDLLKAFLFPLIFVVILVAVHSFQVFSGINLSHFGIQPRQLGGLDGIVFSPLLHGDWNHLIHNSFPLLFLGAGLFSLFRPIAWKVIAGIWLMSGFWIWVAVSPQIAYTVRAEAYVIPTVGASTLVFGLIFFLLFSGFFRRERQAIAMGLAVAFYYGGSILTGLFPEDPRVSWEGHLFGALAGLILAWMLRKQAQARRKKYSWDYEIEDDREDPEAYWNYRKEF